ncbi:hypothetical protein [Streptomyces cylindrosporus]|uniref:Uncharacterized protein n=1 Tax=Streptomyces cylindrosporus TaxID=2927583 RepID=A0ABS9Y4V1_9ACTN|nr:hypothetical protein [Streptomyces cylindrosporus]MCI3272252.1 hypothetical protein [Streptomyces cylindrosporus]
MNRPIPGTVQVAVRHILSDNTTGVLTKTRSITWRDTRYRVRRPASGKHTVQLTCSACEAAVLAEVRDEAGTRRTTTVLRALAALCVLVLVVAFGYAVHEGGKTLPEGQSSPVLFPISIIAIALALIAAPLFFAKSLRYTGVSLLNAPKLHGIMPVRN